MVAPKDSTLPTRDCIYQRTTIGLNFSKPKNKGKQTQKKAVVPDVALSPGNKPPQRLKMAS